MPKLHGTLLDLFLVVQSDIMLLKYDPGEEDEVEEMEEVEEWEEDDDDALYDIQCSFSDLLGSYKQRQNMGLLRANIV